MKRFHGISRVSGLLLFLQCAVLVPVVGAQFRSAPSPTRPMMEEHPGRPFAFDLLSFHGSLDSDRVDLYLAVRYRTLEFLYAGDKYVADYAVNVEIADPSGAEGIKSRYQTYSMLETVREHEDRTRRGDERADAEQMTFSLVSGKKYDVHIEVRDLSSKHQFDTTVHYETRRFVSGAAWNGTRGPSEMSDLMIYRTRRGQRVVPLIGGDVADISGGPSGVFAQLYGMPASATIGVVTEIVSANHDRELSEDDILIRSTSVLATPRSDTAMDRIRMLGQSASLPLMQDISFEDLWVGHYILRTFILLTVADTVLRAPGELAKHAMAYAERRLTVRTERGIPMSGPDIDHALEQLRIIATGSEWDSLTAGTTLREKREAIREFWEKRNPVAAGGSSRPMDRANRPMQVFYARVQYANDHFSSGMEPGWRSDRGHVYIALGSPDFVDAHAYEATQKPYENWEYTSLHVRYAFIDQYMLGDYRLIGAPPARGTFIWDR